jgi:hypothetical protein
MLRLDESGRLSFTLDNNGGTRGRLAWIEKALGTSGSITGWSRARRSWFLAPLTYAMTASSRLPQKWKGALREAGAT